MNQEQNCEDTLDEKVSPTRDEHKAGFAEQAVEKDVPDVLPVEVGSGELAVEANGSSQPPEASSSPIATTTDIEEAPQIAALSSNEAPASDNASSANITKESSPSLQPTDTHTYPEGGLRAWLVVLGCFSGMTACFGLMNSVGVFQAYLSVHQLSHLPPFTVGWIFSIYVFLAFFCGIQIGPVFDAKGPRWLVVGGTVCLVGGVLGVAESTELWHFILSFSLAAGLGTSLIFTPAVSSIAHFFSLRRAAATGIATTGGSIGGIVFPLTLQHLFPMLGFRWATRILAFIFLFLLLVANALIRSRLPPPKTESLASSIWPDWRIFKNKTFVLTTAGVFFVEWALFVPLGYVSSYALAHGLSTTFSFQLLAILNAGSFFGRWAPGFLADKVGRFNTMIITIAMCLVSVLALWLTCGYGEGIVPQLVVFVLIFGFASGSNISLVPVCVGQLCGTEVFGRWYAGLYTVVSFACLTGIPIAGSILGRDGGGYGGLIVFVGVSYAVGLACFVWARVLRVGWGLKEVF